MISSWRNKNWIWCLSARRSKPLAIGINPDRNLVQLCYTSEVASSVLRILQDAALPGKRQLRESLALVVLVALVMMVGAGVSKNPHYTAIASISS